MSAAVSSCKGCGAPLSLAHLRGTECPYCRLAFPHQARAVEQAALVQQVMNQHLNAVSPWIIAQPAPPVNVAFFTEYATEAQRFGERMSRAVMTMILVFTGLGILVAVLCAVLFA